MTDYVYDMSDPERNDLTQQFLGTKKLDSCRFACFTLEGTDPFANIARQVERAVFEDSWGNDANLMKKEWGPYDESSLFFMVVDTQEMVPAGVLRMIRNSPLGLKTLVDLDDNVKSPIAPVAISTDDVMRHHGIDDLDRCWDGSTAAVPRPYRRKLVGIHRQVLRAWYAAAVRENVQHFVSILDAPVYKVVRDVLGIPLVPLVDTPPFTYTDTPNCQAVYAHVSTSLAVAANGNRKLGQKVRDCFAERTFPGLVLQPGR